MRSTTVLGQDRTFQFVRYFDQRFGHAAVIRDHKTLCAQVDAGVGNEADLALCLAVLAEAGLIDIVKLRAALVIAEPVAREKVVEATSQGDGR